ncbi:AAA family ATPase [Haloterrigena longa]|uniref:AAA family ATPase n=2 Tax=Natrinema longum TaxID=370324 RepID=A0A8A2UDY7_9EURY|nr:AAA family ATPase [Natrinema longum]MBZ6493614.1 AAA family ATPase [Natrinema longum]QSW87021.1 AAA family ATPase [Natrinema longum]
MIAIAGSKGGCGKSTVTLGLAEAFARAETPALAIDADRQLPNLHVMTERDRGPTIADLDRGADITEIAQPHPREPTVGIVPAPKSSQAFEFDSLDERLEADGQQVLIDCPSGAGPDVVDPLAQSAGVIVLASNTDRTLDAAETTIEMARRLGVPVYGAILNKCSEIPEPATRWDGVPLLGCVPDRPSPLLNDDVTTAFDEIVETLATQTASDRAPPEYAGDRLPIGIEELDYRLGGGLSPGSVVALVAEPASQAEHILYRATGVRGTLYLSTQRSRENVRRAIESAATGSGTPTTRRVTGDDALEEAASLIDKLPDAANLIVDPIDELERRDRSAYVSFLDELKDRMVETDGLAILYCLEDEPPNRSATLRAADAVFELETVTPAADADIEHLLSVPKYRPKAGLSETFALEFAGDGGVAPIESAPGAE